MSNLIPPDMPSFEDIPPIAHPDQPPPSRPVSSTPIRPMRDSVTSHPIEDPDKAAEKAAKRKILKEEADTAIQKLQYLKQLVKSIPKEKSPELQALMSFERKLDLILTKQEIIQQKTVKMSNELEVYNYEMAVAIEKINDAIAIYNKLPITPDTTAAFQAAIDAYRTAVSAASQVYQKAAGIYNAVVMTVPGVNVQLAALKLPRISPIPTAAPPLVDISEGPYAPPALSRPVQALPQLTPYQPLVQVNSPLPKAEALEISLGSAIQSLFNAVAQPLDIQKHMDRHV